MKKPTAFALFRLWLSATCILISIASFSQKESSAFDSKIIKEFCDEFTKGSPTITKENMEMELGLIILPIMTKYGEEIKKEWGLDITSQTDMEKIGHKIGQLGATQCVAFRSFIMDNLTTIVESRGLKTQGKLLKIEGQPFSYLVVQNNSGKIEKIYWLEFFEGADKLTTPSTVLNKTVTIEYKELEVYDATSKEYKKIKVATKLKY